MKIAVWITICSVIFSFAGAQDSFRTDAVNEETATGTQVEATNQTAQDSFVTAAGKCFLGGLLFAGDSCGQSISETLASIGLEGLSQTVITITNGITAFRDGLFSFLTFNVPGAPNWVRAIISVPLNIGLVYTVIAIARGI